MNEKLISMYSSGMTCRQISDITGIPTTTVWYRLKRLGVQMLQTADRIRGNRNIQSRKFDWYESAKLYKSGLNSVDIAKKLKVTKSAIVHSLKEQGIQLRTSGESVSKKSIGNSSISSHGYVRISTGRKQRQYEHILIAEKALGRDLIKVKLFITSIVTRQTIDRKTYLFVLTSIIWRFTRE